VNQKNGNVKAARKEYENSMKLLPVADAQYGLGIIERDAGNTGKAKQYLSAAAQTEGEVGKKATSALKEMGFGVEGSGPASYVTVNQGLSKKGTFAIQLINNTSRPVTGIKIGVFMNGKRTTSNIDGVLGAGATKVIDTGRKMSRAEAKAVELEVLDAVAQ